MRTSFLRVQFCVRHGPLCLLKIWILFAFPKSTWSKRFRCKKPFSESRCVKRFGLAKCYKPLVTEEVNHHVLSLRRSRVSGKPHFFLVLSWVERSRLRAFIWRNNTEKYFSECTRVPNICAPLVPRRARDEPLTALYKGRSANNAARNITLEKKWLGWIKRYRAFRKIRFHLLEWN